MESNEYWMIERSINGSAHWWVSAGEVDYHWSHPNRWTTDSSKARHFESEADAVYVMGYDMQDCEATGHIDCSGPDLTV